jgi:hypothetical protein
VLGGTLIVWWENSDHFGHWAYRTYVR